VQGSGADLAVVLVRHGATAWNENRYCQGRRDVPLSARGRMQAGHLRDALSGVRFARAFSSPLVRAVETARTIGVEPAILPDLVELDRGHWEGHPMDEVRRRWVKLHEAWYRDPTGLAMPGGEAFDALWERAARVLETLRGPGGPVLASGHKAINRAIVARALGRTPRDVWAIAQPQACRTLLLLSGDRWTAETIGDASHLPEPLRSED